MGLEQGPSRPGTTCPVCNGKGKIDGRTCPECHGSGKKPGFAKSKTQSTNNQKQILQ